FSFAYKLSLILHIPFYFLPGNADFRLTTIEALLVARARRLASTKSLNGYYTIALSRRRPVESRFLGQSPFSCARLRITVTRSRTTAWYRQHSHDNDSSHNCK
ncbi:hypothetical protein ALC57_00952, partial [Trachymyrmex cornetzi]